VLGITFSFEEMIRELETANRLMSRFLQNGQQIIPQLKGALEAFQSGGISTLNWQVKENNAIYTQISHGHCEPGGHGIDVVGSLSFIWQIARVKASKKATKPKYFHLVGKASTVARVYSVGPDDKIGDEIAMWRMEIGDHQSPGCHFHVQVLGEDAPPFPKTMSIPRFPGLMPTPMAGLEFLLAEIFQDEWKKHLGDESEHLKRWRALQRQRLQKLLAWQQSEIAKDTASPWVALKIGKPDSDIFLRDGA
jgi:hypothetical protein